MMWPGPTAVISSWAVAMPTFTTRTRRVPSASPARSTRTSTPRPGDAPGLPMISQTRSTGASSGLVIVNWFT